MTERPQWGIPATGDFQPLLSALERTREAAIVGTLPPESFAQLTEALEPLRQLAPSLGAQFAELAKNTRALGRLYDLSISRQKKETR